MVLFRLTTVDVEEEQTSILLTSLKWIKAFFDICPGDIMPFVPSLLSHVLPRMSHDVDDVRKEAQEVNGALMEYIMSLSEDRPLNGNMSDRIQLPPSLSELGKELTGTQRRDSNLSARLLKAVIRDQTPEGKTGTQSPTPGEDRGPSPRPVPELDYQASVSALTLQFLNEHEATRVAAIAWLIMLHRMAPGRVGSHLIIHYVPTNDWVDTHGRRWDLPCLAEDPVRPLGCCCHARPATAFADLHAQ